MRWPSLNFSLHAMKPASRNRAAREDVPRIVAELVAAGEQVYSVQLLRSTLEERYLEVVA